MNGLLRCFDHLQCLSLFVIFFCIIKLLSRFCLMVNYVTVFRLLRKHVLFFCSKLISWEEIILNWYFFGEHWYRYFYIFFIIRGMTGFYCFALYFFHSYEKITVFFRFSWLSVISQRDIVDHWHGYIHYTSYLRKSGLFCSICCKTTCCGCMVLEGHVVVCNLRSMSWSFSNFLWRNILHTFILLSTSCET